MGHNRGRRGNPSRQTSKPRRTPRGGNRTAEFDSVKHTLDSVCRLMAAIDTPVALSTVILIRYEQWRDLCERGLTTLDLNSYQSAEAFRKDYLAVTILSKSEFLETGIDKQGVALAGFYEGEEKCAQTNRRLAREGSTPEPVWLAIRLARQKISRLLGSFDWNECADGFGFGPGGTTRVPRREACLLTKVCGELHTTFDNLPVARAILERAPGWKAGLERAADGRQESAPILTLVHGNKVTTVPKNAKTDRVIASEPDLNIYAQKGIGAMLKRRLRNVGCDTGKQEPNQALARLGSLDGSLATIDLSAASDTISKSIVELLLPEDWYRAMDLTRSKYGTIGGDRILYRKFSTMGNGFTFELETLIFWALCSAVIDLARVPLRTLRVYGDDIICPSAVYRDVVEVLEYVGFAVNPRKSFHQGAFRESCGKHYWFGDDVTPFYVKTPLKGPHRAFWWVNAIRKWSSREILGTVYCDREMEGFWRDEVAALPRKWQRFRVPEGTHESNGIISPRSEAPEVRYSRKRCALMYPVLLEVEVKREVTRLNGFPVDRETGIGWEPFAWQVGRTVTPSDFDLYPALIRWSLGCKNPREEIPVEPEVNVVPGGSTQVRASVGYVEPWRNPGDWM